MARRSKATTKEPSDGGNRRWLVLGAIAVAVGLIAWTAWPDPPVVGREANIAAFGVSDDPFMGDPDAPVVLVGYESPHCSACQRFHLQVLPSLQEHFDLGNVVYHYVQGTIGGDFESNMAQECAHREGGNPAFWRLTDMFYQRSNTYSTPDLQSWLRHVADEQDLDGDAMVQCLRDGATSRQVSQDWSVGSDHGARGTPTFWAFGPEGEAVQVGNYGQLPAVLDQLVAEAAAP